MDLKDIIGALGGRLGGSLQAHSPFKGDPRAAFSPFATAALRAAAPGFQALQARTPFKNGLAAESPFGGKGFNAPAPFAGRFLGGSTPFGGSPISRVPVFNPFAPKAPVDPLTGLPIVPGATGGQAGTPSTGIAPGVAQWTQRMKDTFGGLDPDLPDVMLAIITNESGGDPYVQNHMGQPAYGLFQLWQQPGLDIDQQFVAAQKLAAGKLQDIKNAYAKNGLAPDARTRARDFALAWAGHFDYATGQPNSASRDVGSGQTAAQLSAVFLANYDKIKAGRAAAPVAGGGIPGSMASIWGGGAAPIMQEFGQTDYSAAHPYDYGGDFGMGSGHHGLDIGLNRGTKLFAPVGGTVTIAGGSGYFRDDMGGIGDAPGRGELRIRLDNGEEVILGHMASIGVHVGDRINAGQFVGLSGGADGAHLHLEWRVRGNTGTGWQVVDPRTKLK